MNRRSVLCACLASVTTKRAPLRWMNGSGEHQTNQHPGDRDEVTLVAPRCFSQPVVQPGE